MALNRRAFMLSSGLLTMTALAQDKLPNKRKELSDSTKRPRFALVLGGGSARGFAHIGVLKALDKAEIKPDLIVGTSAGSLVGVFYAAGFTGVQIEKAALEIRDTEIVDLDSGNRRGMIGGAALQKLVNRLLNNRPIEQLKIPFVATATNLHTGEAMLFKSGDAGFAVRSSCSIPGVFIPAKRGDDEFLDGGLISPVPAKIARDLGAEFIVASVVNVNPSPAKITGMFELLMQSFDVMQAALTRANLSDADIVIMPDVAHISPTDFSARSTLIAIGEQTGTKMIPSIKTKLKQQ